MRLSNIITKIITPSSWMRNKKVNPIIDNWFRKQLENPIFTDIGDCTCKLNGVEIWIANRYYGGPKIYHDSSAPDGYCNIDTAKKLYKLVDKEQNKIISRKNENWLKNKGIKLESSVKTIRKSVPKPINSNKYKIKY